MHRSVVLWSIASGVLMGLLVDVTLAAIWATTVIALDGRVSPSAGVAIGVAVVLGAIPLAAGALGFFEGRLKLR